NGSSNKNTNTEEERTSKIKKGKAKADQVFETSLWRKMKDVEKMITSINNRKIKLVATIEDMKNSQNLFYAYTKARNSSIIATFSQLSPSLILDFPMFLPIIRNYEHSSTNDDFKDQERSVASPLIVQVFDNDKDEESRDIEGCLHKIDSLFEDYIFPDQDDTIVDKEPATAEQEIVAEEKEVAEEEKRKRREILMGILSPHPNLWVQILII
ncbi:hypothetical protein J1N35_011417, partial [Gossypium stocksii]